MREEPPGSGRLRAVGFRDRLQITPTGTVSGKKSKKKSIKNTFCHSDSCSSANGGLLLTPGNSLFM